jgi:hypothetical protein
VQREFETDLLPTLGTTPLHHGQVRSPLLACSPVCIVFLFSNCCGTIVRRLIVRVKDLERSMFRCEHRRNLSGEIFW